MNKTALFCLTSFLTCGCVCTMVHPVESQGQALDIAPFALPGTPANEVRFEDPREIREVVVTFRSTTPGHLGLSYLHKTWREERQDLQDLTQDVFDRGWIKIDDWFGGSWNKGAVRFERTGDRTAVLSFDMLSKDGFPFAGRDVDYRLTLGVRVDGVAPEALEKVEVHTTARPRQTKLRVTLDAGRPTPDRTVRIEAHNCNILSLAAEQGTERLNAREVRLLDPTNAPRSFLVDVRHQVSGHPFAHDEGLVTFGMDGDRFTLSLDALLAKGPLWHASGSVFVTTADDPTTFEAYYLQHLRRAGPPPQNLPDGVPRTEGCIASTVARMPEQSLARARLGQPERQPVPMMLGCKYNRNRFRIEINGDITMEMGDYWESKPQAHRFFFGLERWSRVANYTAPAPALIYHVERINGTLRVDQESFAAPLLKSVGAALAADEPTVCLVRFTLKNEGTTPAAATLPIAFSARSKHTRHPEQGGERSGVPPSPRDLLAVTNNTENVSGADERLLHATADGKTEVRGALRTDMAISPEGKSLVLRKALAPGASCQVLLKVTRKPVTTEEERAALARLDYDTLRGQTARFWDQEAAPWAEIETPEPDLNAFHKAHLAHVMISDHRMPGEEELIATSVGADAYGNVSNESAMILEELEERGLHEDVRKRLALWLKYQGTAKLVGRFSDQDGVFFGAGGSESGDSYVQNHGWIMWALAEHYFMTRDKAWLAQIAGHLVRGADWVARQRRLTLVQQPLSRGWERGFLPASALEDVVDLFFWTSSNIWTWRGMDHAASALAVIGHPEAGRIRAEADGYHADILRGLTIARQNNPLVRLRDGRWVPHYPTHIYRRGRDLGWIRETLEGSVNLLISGFLDPNGTEASWILDDYQDNLYIAGEYGYPIPEFNALWFDWAGFSCQPNLLAGLMPYLDRDEIEVYLWMFFNAFNATYSPNIQGMVEHPRPVLGFSNAEVFKTSDEANSVKWLRYMFVYGKGETLHLGRALPREWLSGGNSIHLKRIHTRFGVVSVQYETDSAQDRITCRADLALTSAPKQLLVRFRHPEKRLIQSVRVNGVEHRKFDPLKGDVDISGTSGALTVTASFAPASTSQGPTPPADGK